MVDLLADPVKVPQDEGEGEGVHHSGVQPLPVDPDVDPQVGALAKDGLPLEAEELYAGVNGGGGVLLLLGLEDRELPGGQDLPARHQQQLPNVRQLRQHLAQPPLEQAPLPLGGRLHPQVLRDMEVMPPPFHIAHCWTAQHPVGEDDILSCPPFLTPP